MPLTGRPASTISTSRARSLRRRTTGREVRLRRALKLLGPQGFHFRRQGPTDACVVDFACLRRGVVIEIDGGQHGEPEHLSTDPDRDRRLADLGFQVFGFWNSEVAENLDGVVETVLARARSGR